MTSPRKNWKRFKGGERQIPKSWLNDVSRTLGQLDAAGQVFGYRSDSVNAPLLPGAPILRIVEMKERLSGEDDEKSELEAYPLYYNTSSEEWQRIDENRYYETVANPFDENLTLENGEYCVALWLSQAKAFVPIATPINIRRFELRDALTCGGSATAKWLYWDEDDSDYDTETTDYEEVTFTVWDAARRHEQYAVPTDVVGAYGYAKWMPDSSRWEIIEKQACARSCEATLVGALEETDDSISVDNVVPIDGGFSPVFQSTDTLTVQNRYSWEGDDGGNAEIYWNGSVWKFRQVECPA